MCLKTLVLAAVLSGRILPLQPIPPIAYERAASCEDTHDSVRHNGPLVYQCIPWGKVIATQEAYQSPAPMFPG